MDEENNVSQSKEWTENQRNPRPKNHSFNPERKKGVRGNKKVESREKNLVHLEFHSAWTKGKE